MIGPWAEAKGCFGKATEPEAKASGGVVPKQKSQVSQSYSPQNSYPYLIPFFFSPYFSIRYILANCKYKKKLINFLIKINQSTTYFLSENFSCTNLLSN